MTGQKRKLLKNSAAFKVLTWLTIGLFSFSNFLWSAPVASVAVSPVVKSSEISNIIYGIEIPEVLGKIKSRYIPEQNKSQSPVIIHIQDAHAQPDAQRNIQSILEHLRSQNRLQLIAVEGAFGKIDPGLLEFFPLQEINQTITEQLTDLGEITGVELFALKYKDENIPIWGVEDERVYKKGFSIFKKIKSVKGNIFDNLEVYSKQLEQLEIQIFNPDLESYVLRQKSWKRKQEDMLSYFRVLSSLAERYLHLDLSDPANQFDWPNLSRMMKVDEMEASLKMELAIREGNEMVTDIRKAHQDSTSSKQLLIQQYLTAGLQGFLSENALSSIATNAHFPNIKTLRHFMEFVYENTKSYNIELIHYPNFMDYCGLQILNEEIQGLKMFDEMSRLETDIEAKITQTAEEKDLLSLEKDYMLLEKLLALSITREEFDTFQDRKEQLEPEVFRKRFLELGQSHVNYPLIPKGLVETAEEFYQLSRLRDDSLFENSIEAKRLISEDSNQEIKVVVLIAGGFHSQGFVELFKERNIAHLVITPAIQNLRSPELYEKIMTGENTDINKLAAANNTWAKLLFTEGSATHARHSAITNGFRDINLTALSIGASEMTQRGLSPREIIQNLTIALRARNLSQDVNFTIARDKVSVSIDGKVIPLFDVTREEANEIDLNAVNTRLHSESPDISAVMTEVAEVVEFETPVVGADVSEARNHPLSIKDLPPREELKLNEFYIKEAKKALKYPEEADIPQAVTISDEHGEIGKMDEMILDRMKEYLSLNAPEKLKYLPEKLEVFNPRAVSSKTGFLRSGYVSIAEQLGAGLTLEDFKGGLIFENIGDLMDRGPHGIKVSWRTMELFNAGLSTFIPGNHDIMFMLSMMGYHLPYYRGYNFYGNGGIAELVESKKAESSHIIPNPESDPLLWAERVKEFVEYQKKKQKDHWDIFDEITKMLYGDVQNTLPDSQKEMWNKLRGFYYVNVNTGTRAAGMVSLLWWKELLKEFKDTYDAMEQNNNFKPASKSSEAWREAIRMIEKEIIPEIQREHEEMKAQGKWWWPVVDQINYGNYISPEYYGMDWIFHRKWGPFLLDEANRMRAAVVNQKELADVTEEDIAQLGNQLITSANYLEQDALKDINNFIVKHFNLTTLNVFQNRSLHAFLPTFKHTAEDLSKYPELTGIGQKGQFVFRFQGQVYIGGGIPKKGLPSVWEGLDRISEMVRKVPDLTRGSEEDVKAFQEVMNLVMSWYGDETTETKPEHMLAAIEMAGGNALYGESAHEAFVRINGARSITTGHNPPRSFMKFSPEVRALMLGRAFNGGVVNLSDGGFAEAYGYLGLVLVMDAFGARARGWQFAADTEEKRAALESLVNQSGYSNGLVNNPTLVEIGPGPGGSLDEISVARTNPGIDRAEFLSRWIEGLEKRNQELNVQIALGQSDDSESRNQLLQFGTMTPEYLAANKSKMVPIFISGGEGAGVNDYFAYAAREIRNLDLGLIPVAVEEGIKGLSAEDLHTHLAVVDEEATDKLIGLGGIAAYTSRVNLLDSKNRARLETAINNMSGFHSFLPIGGGDHAVFWARLAEELETNNDLSHLKDKGIEIIQKMNVVYKTIDGDVHGQPLGFETAVWEAQREIYSIAASVKGQKGSVAVVSIMGADAGLLAAMGGSRNPSNIEFLKKSRRGEDKELANLIEAHKDSVLTLIPELPLSIEELLVKVRDVRDKEGSVTLVVSEGFRFKDSDMQTTNSFIKGLIAEDSEYFDEKGRTAFRAYENAPKDPHGNVKWSEAEQPELVAAILRQHLNADPNKKIRIRTDNIGYVLRGMPSAAGYFDQIYAQVLAKKIAELYGKGVYGHVVSLPPLSSSIHETFAETLDSPPDNVDNLVDFVAEKVYQSGALETKTFGEVMELIDRYGLLNTLYVFNREQLENMGVVIPNNFRIKTPKIREIQQKYGLGDFSEARTPSTPIGTLRFTPEDIRKLLAPPALPNQDPRQAIEWRLNQEFSIKDSRDTLLTDLELRSKTIAKNLGGQHVLHEYRLRKPFDFILAEAIENSIDTYLQKHGINSLQDFDNKTDLATLAIDVSTFDEISEDESTIDVVIQITDNGLSPTQSETTDQKRELRSKGILRVGGKGAFMNNLKRLIDKFIPDLSNAIEFNYLDRKSDLGEEQAGTAFEIRVRVKDDSASSEKRARIAAPSGEKRADGSEHQSGYNKFMETVTGQSDYLARRHVAIVLTGKFVAPLGEQRDRATEEFIVWDLDLNSEMGTDGAGIEDGNISFSGLDIILATQLRGDDYYAGIANVLQEHPNLFIEIFMVGADVNEENVSARDGLFDKEHAFGDRFTIRAVKDENLQREVEETLARVHKALNAKGIKVGTLSDLLKHVSLAGPESAQGLLEQVRSPVQHTIIDDSIDHPGVKVYRINREALLALGLGEEIDELGKILEQRVIYASQFISDNNIDLIVIGFENSRKFYTAA